MPYPIGLASLQEEEETPGTCTEKKDPVRTQRKDGHLQAKERVLRRNLDLGTLILAL